MQPDVSVPVQCILEKTIDVSHSCRSGHDVDIVQIREHLLACVQLALDGLQWAVLAQRDEEGHEEVPLFASLSLCVVCMVPPLSSKRYREG